MYREKISKGVRGNLSRRIAQINTKVESFTGARNDAYNPPLEHYSPLAKLLVLMKERER